jgi:Fe2+ or Zn2+ uptake regulation protein
VFQLSQDIDLKQCVIQDVDDINDEVSFQIYTQKKSFTVSCKSKSECKEWRDEIEKALQAIQSKSGDAVKLAPRSVCVCVSFKQ